MKSFINFTKIKAFTLAEVLITLGIIGIVAALTLPSLIQNYREKENVTKLKKITSTINQALLTSISGNETIDNWNTTPDETGAINFADKIKPYLKIIQDCGTRNTNCLTSTGYFLLNNKSDANFNLTNSYYKIILADGSTLFWRGWESECSDTIPCIEFHMDINGKHSPNTMGKDEFYFFVYKNKLVPAGYKNEDNSLYYDSFDKSCYTSGYGCTAWVLQYENMDYLHCDGLTWSGKHSCK